MITLLWWLFPPKIFTNPFFKRKKQDISTSIYKWKAKLLQAKFYLNIMIRFGKEKQSDQSDSDSREDTALEFEVSSKRSNNLRQVEILN